MGLANRMAAFRIFLIAVVTAMSLLGPVAAAERAAARANCHQTLAMSAIAPEAGDNWSNEARLFYCQMASSILPDCTLPAPDAGTIPVFSLFTTIVSPRDVPPGERPPRQAIAAIALS